MTHLTSKIEKCLPSFTASFRIRFTAILSIWWKFTSNAPLFSHCSAGYVPVKGAWHGCWCVITSDIIVLSISNISNAWITHDCKCDICCLCLKWDICFHCMSLLCLFHLICNWIIKPERLKFKSIISIYTFEFFHVVEIVVVVVIDVALLVLHFHWTQNTIHTSLTVFWDM